jgi:hypothetical protein
MLGPSSSSVATTAAVHWVLRKLALDPACSITHLLRSAHLRCYLGTFCISILLALLNTI